MGVIAIDVVNYQYLQMTGTAVISNIDPEVNKTVLREKLTVITEFLQTNELTINQDKTKTQDFMVQQRRRYYTGDDATLEVTTDEGEVEVIKNQKFTRLLGLNFYRDLSWRAHLELGTKLLLPTLRRRLGAWKHLGNQLPKQRQIECLQMD